MQGISIIGIPAKEVGSRIEKLANTLKEYGILIPQEDGIILEPGSGPEDDEMLINGAMVHVVFTREPH